MPVLVIHDELDEEVEAYPFEELSDDAKMNAKVNAGWDEHHSDMCVETMKEASWEALGGLTSWELQYSIGFCQGDGVGIKGTMDATDIPDPEWRAKILPLLGAHKHRATVAGHDVSWPRPIIEAHLEFEEIRRGCGSSPCFSAGDLEVTFVFPEAEDTGGWYDDWAENGELVVNVYSAREPEDRDANAIAIWEAMVDYFHTLCGRLYRECADEILEGWDEGFVEECAERNMLFDETGRVVQEEIP
jgi:hypothetical protein